MNATEEKATAQKPPTVLGAYFARLRDPNTRKRTLALTAGFVATILGGAAVTYYRGYRRGQESSQMMAWEGDE